jgi:hypothetical protein
MEHPKLTRLLVPAALAALLAGCGLSDPYQADTTHQHTTRAAPKTPTPTPPPPSTLTTSGLTTAGEAGDPPSERDGTVPATIKAAANRVSPTAASPTPRAAVLRYTRLYVNWTGGRLVTNQRELARISVGSARLQARQAAASATADTQLTADHVTNRGEIVSAQPGDGPAAGTWVIVTAEKTVGTGDYQGLPAAVHVTCATVTHLSSGWVISQWAPQS